MIHKSYNHSGLTELRKAALQDIGLSYCARGILAMVMSYDGSAVISFDWIKANTKKEDWRAVERAIAELDRAGYLTLRPVIKGGELVGTEWHISDVPDQKGPGL